jgi:hypothetical protein
VWLAPEVIRSQPYTTKADVYGAGVIFWELASKQRFFDEITFVLFLFIFSHSILIICSFLVL